MLPSCHSELRASDAELGSSYVTIRTWLQYFQITVLYIIVLDAGIGSVDTVCGQNSLSHQKQKEKNWEKCEEGTFWSNSNHNNVIIT